MVEPALISTAGGSRPIAKIQSLSLSCTNSGQSAYSKFSSSESARSSSVGPVEQVSFHQILVSQTICSCLTSSWNPVQQHGGHLDILTSLVTQLTSGLCLCSEECPRISFSFPRLVIANNVLSECPSYHRMRLTTLVMEPDLFRVPSMLWTRISLESFWVQSLQLFTYCQSMNLPVAPESAREFIDLISAVSVVSTSTFNQRDFGLSLEAAMTSLGGSHLSHLGQWVWGESDWGLCMTSVVSAVSFTS